MPDAEVPSEDDFDQEFQLSSEPDSRGKGLKRKHFYWALTAVGAIVVIGTVIFVIVYEVEQHDSSSSHSTTMQTTNSTSRTQTTEFSVLPNTSSLSPVTSTTSSGTSTTLFTTSTTTFGEVTSTSSMPTSSRTNTTTKSTTTSTDMTSTASTSGSITVSSTKAATTNATGTTPIAPTTGTTIIKSTATTTSDEKCQEFHQCTSNFQKPPLLVISFDGFRNSYLNLSITPTIQKLFDCGTHSKFMIPSFPSKTFPNHYAIATGLYPAWHGIVDNSFRDPTVPGENFTQSTKARGWYLGEPIWETIQKTGMKSAVYFWPGSEAPDHYPTYYTVYNKAVPYESRADKIVEWLKMSENDRPQLLMLYMEEPDEGGHTGGPDSQQVTDGMRRMDSVLSYLINKLTNEGFLGCMNIILVSDHGMQYIDYSRAVLMNHYLPADFQEILYPGVVAHIAVSHPGTDADSLVEKMKCKEGSDYLVHKRKLTPSRYHYGGSIRNGDFVIEGRAGVYIMSNEQMLEANKYYHGNHGFDNRLPSMRAIFGAVGPSIAEKREITDFENIELYNLFADLLGISPAPNNGTKGHLYSVLKDPPLYEETTPIGENVACLHSVEITSCDPTNCPDVRKMTDGCLKDTSTIEFEISNGAECQHQLCEAVVHYNRAFEKVQLIEATISATDWSIASPNCTSVISDLSSPCPQEQNDNYISLFIMKDVYNTLDIAKVPVNQGFKNGAWRFLADKITHYVQTYSKMSMYVGVGYDSNGDSVRDPNEDISSAIFPTHLFAMLLRCPDDPDADRHSCRNPVTISFILPNIEVDFNCLPPDEYLWQNTARIKDVEILSGIQFFRNRSIWSTEDAIRLRTQVLPELWA